jgi:hypothetical protein
MTATLCSRRLSTVVFLMLCGAAFRAEAQQFACWPIVRGDTASGLARRLTGTAANTYSEAFQIRDPARQKFVPKSQYSRLSTNWRACVSSELVKSGVRGPALATAAAASTAPPAAPSAISHAAASAVLPAAAQYDISFAVTFGIAVSLMLLMITALSSYAARRPVPPALQRAGEDFLKAFATPLVDPTSAAPPIAGHLRFIPRKQRLEICIAPLGRRRYPNLADHKTNVVYDVGRVIGIMGADRIVCDRLHAEGPWVVVSIRLAGPKGPGAM